MITNKSNKLFQVFILILPIAFLLFFLVLPILFTLNSSFININSGNFTFQNYISVLNDQLTQYFIYWTFYESIITTIIAIFLGVGCSYILTHYNVPAKRFIRNLLTVPFLLPSITVLIGFIVVFGDNIFSSNGIILANLFYNLPLMIRLTELGWISINPEYEVVAKSLSMSRLSYFYHVELRHLAPSILTASLLVFIYSFNGFAIVLVLGGIQYQTIEVRIYYLFLGIQFDEASALAIFSLLINICVVFIYLHFSSQYQTNMENYSYETKDITKFVSKKLRMRIFRMVFFVFFSIVIFVICIYPLLGIFQTAFIVNNKLSFKNFINLLSETIPPYGITVQDMVYNSLFFAISVLIISIIFSLLLNFGLNYKSTNNPPPVLSFQYLTNVIVILPLMVSAITLIYSIFSLYKTTFLYENIGLIIIISDSLIAFPFANRIIATARSNINEELLDVGKSLGLNRLKVFLKIELPLLFSSIIVAGIFSFAISMGEFASTYFISRSNTATIPLGIYSLISIERNIPEAAALSSILILVTLFIFYFIERFSKFDFRI